MSSYPHNRNLILENLPSSAPFVRLSREPGFIVLSAVTVPARLLSVPLKLSALQANKAQFPQPLGAQVLQLPGNAGTYTAYYISDLLS